MDGQMDGWMDGRTDGCIVKAVHVALKYLYALSSAYFPDFNHYISSLITL